MDMDKVRLVSQGNLQMKLVFFLIMAGMHLSFSANAQRSFTFVQLCDPQLGFGGYQHDSISLVQAVNAINAIDTDFVIICGDLVHDASDTSYSDFLSIVSKLKIPVYYTPGNHDIGNEPTAESLAFYRKTIGKDYFTFRHKGYTFIIANSSLWLAPLEDESGKQDQWLEEIITKKSAGQKPVVIAAHYPLFIEDPEEQSGYFSIQYEKRNELLTLFEKADVVAYLSGHAHRLLINQYNDMQMVSGESTSVNFDKRPLGFRLWHVTKASLENEFVSLE